MGPRKSDVNHQATALLPFDCARPALIRESVNQPTAYPPASWATDPSPRIKVSEDDSTKVEVGTRRFQRAIFQRCASVRM